MAIIVSKNNHNAKRIDESHFDLEDHLQEYIYDSPDVVPVYEIEENTRLFIAAREFSTNSGPIDALGFDQNGNIYVIETKLFKNPDKRTVVAQALDYGASLWRHKVDFNEFIAQLNSHTEKQFNKTFELAFEDFFEVDVSMAMENMRNNLGEGVIKFVILMDSLHDRLKDLIVYVNQNSKFDIYAVELEYYKHDEFEIVIPKLFGSEVKKDVVPQNTQSNYSYSLATADDFNDAVNSQSDLNQDGKRILFSLRDLYSQLANKCNASVSYSKSGKANRLIFTVSTDNGKVATIYSNGELWFYRRNEDNPIMNYCERILHRLVEEDILDKTAKNLDATQWSIRSLYFRNPNDDQAIQTQLERFVEINEDEVQAYTDRPG